MVDPNSLKKSDRRLKNEMVTGFAHDIDYD